MAAVTGLLNQSYFALFLIVALGLMVGRLRIRDVSLDSSAVIFVALLFGHWGATVPGDFQYIGLILFIYTMGLQAGPGFFEVFRKHGRALSLLAVLMVGSAGITTVLLAHLAGLDHKLAVGLLAGALTSTPGLAAAIESSQSPLASIGYGVSYPFGVVGVILVLRVLPKLLGIDLAQASATYDQETRASHPQLFQQNFLVEKPTVDGRSIADLRVRSSTGATVSRIMQQGKTVTPNQDTMLHAGDRLKAVGTRAALERLGAMVGRTCLEELPLTEGYEVQWLLVTNKEVVNKTLAELNLRIRYNASVTRIRRSGIDISPEPHSRVRFGDKLMIAADGETMKQLARLVGNDERRLSMTDFLPFSVGIVVGILLGRVVLSFGTLSFSLGISGGVLIMGLLLGRLGKVGPLMWSMSGGANQLLRELGLLFFLAAVGTEAGARLVGTIHENGWQLLGVGAVITIVPMLVGAWVGHRVLRLNFLTLLGATAGSMTSTPGLAGVTSLSDSNAPAVAYATVYPVAMVAMIVACQIIGRW